MPPCAGLTGQLIMPVCRQYVAPDIRGTSRGRVSPEQFPCQFNRQRYSQRISRNVFRVGMPGNTSHAALPATTPLPARLTEHKSRHCSGCQSAAAIETAPLSTYPMVEPVTCDSDCRQGVEHYIERWSGLSGPAIPGTEVYRPSVKISAIRAC